MLLTCYGLLQKNTYASLGGTFLVFIGFYQIYVFVTRRFTAMDDFFESVKYRDFSRFFVEAKGPQDIRRLNKGFNLVNRTIRDMNSERQMQFVYLQKILEMVDVGIIAYNLESGAVLWSNDSFLSILDFPAFKDIKFIARRRPKVYAQLFETYHHNATSVNLDMNQETIKVLVSDTVFTLEEGSFKLIVLQNIERTLDKNEADAWKKLLSVMTHEIMNSIAPISSLAETLQHQVQATIKNEQEEPLDLQDMNDGILSIKKRSEGLMKFAKTYRSLNKVTELNLSTIAVTTLFKNIEDLMRPSLIKKNIELHFSTEQNNLELEIDVYLIEQVLINLILNAIDACKDCAKPEIHISASRNLRGHTTLKVHDNGSGIPPEVLENIFVPFFSTKKTGSGIGLSLCKQFMTLHQGKIQVNSTVSAGTVFTLIF